MAGPIPMGPFSMPMYREWVPKQIRPWLYVLMALMFQLSGCIYLGAASQITGTTLHNPINITSSRISPVVPVICEAAPR